MNSYLLSICSAVYATLAVLIFIQARQRANTLLALCCCWTSVSALYGIFWPEPAMSGGSDFLDLGRTLAWYTYLLYLYEKSGVGTIRQTLSFSLVAIGALTASLISAYMFDGSTSYSLFSAPIFVRLMVCICELLLIENLYFNLPERARWHIALPCILLGSIACFDIFVSADAVLFRRPSTELLSARTIALIIVAPFLVLTAVRNQRWNEPMRLSRSAVFHSATLVLSGSVLLTLALAGEALRHLDETWGWVAELSLVFAGLIGILICLSSRSARSLIDRIVVYHLFADRYDYRVQWLSCIGTLSGSGSGEESDLKTRAIRAVADPINSPNGTLFNWDNITGSLTWASSWNMPTGVKVLKLRQLAQKMFSENQVVDLRRSEFDLLHAELTQELGPVWLAIPLLHGRGMIGLVVVGPPRMLFRIDQEVFDLLGILGKEVGTHLAEQRAAEGLMETRSLHEYSKRFAFVAHDIKNVSSQLALLLNNAEYYLEDPEFQRDMLGTVRSSVLKIDRLLRRLDSRSLNSTPMLIDPTNQIKALLKIYQRASSVILTLKYDGTVGQILINTESFDTIITHLLNNAIEAAPLQSVLVTIDQNSDQIVIEILDHGQGMSEEFIRDELFSPLKTSKGGGSGIGAFQARELINEAAGELLVISRPGKGTLMRLLFRRADMAMSAPASSVPIRTIEG